MAAVGNRAGQVKIRAGTNSRSEDDSQPEDGKVGNVVRKWAVYEDRMIADRIQSEEIQQHYNKNRLNRRTVREDIPVAKEVYSEESAKAQYERMKQLEEQRKIAEKDERVARELQSRMTDAQREELRRKQLHDEVVSSHMRQVRLHQSQPSHAAHQYRPNGQQEFARHMQEREARRRHEQTTPAGVSAHPTRSQRPNQLPYGQQREVEGRQLQPDTPPTDDYQHLSEAVGGPTLASLQTGNHSTQNSFGEDFDEEALEAEDRELAVRLQQEEKERYERKKQQRMLAKERKRLERLIEQSRRQDMGGSRYPAPVSREDDSDFSDFYIPPDPNMPPDQSRRLQEEQDAELARLMQSHEKGPRDEALKERLRQLEAQDLELAKIVQEEENLRAKRRALKHKQKLLQQQKTVNKDKREVAERLAAQVHTPDSTISSTNTSHQTTPQPARVPPRSASRPADARPSESQHPSDPPTSNYRIAATSAQPVPAVASKSAGVPPRSESYQITRLDSTPKPSSTSSGVTDATSVASTGAAGKAPTAGGRQAKIPINLPGRMMHNTDAELRAGADRYSVSTDVPTSRSADTPRRDMYGEKPSAGRGAYSPSVSSRDLSPPGPALPERRYRDDYPSPPSHGQERSLPTQSDRQQGHRDSFRPSHSHRQPQPPCHSNLPASDRSYPLTEHNVRGHERGYNGHLQVDVGGQGRGAHAGDSHQSRAQDIPPYRGLHPPPYPANYHRSGGSSEGPSSSPRSAETHYDAPWDMSQLESQLLRDASMNQQQQSIIPRQVSPPGRKAPPPVQGPGGRPLIESNEDGQIVMNIAEMIDPTYQRRNVQRATADGYDPADGEITAIAGQRRSGKKNAGKRESCKQQ